MLESFHLRAVFYLLITYLYHNAQYSYPVRVLRSSCEIAILCIVVNDVKFSRETVILYNIFKNQINQFLKRYCSSLRLDTLLESHSVNFHLYM